MPLYLGSSSQGRSNTVQGLIPKDAEALCANRRPHPQGFWNRRSFLLTPNKPGPSHYLSMLQGILKGVLTSSLMGPSSLSSSDSSFTHWWFGKNSLHFPLCGSRIRLGGRGGGGTCSGGGSRSSWESSFHCSWKKQQMESHQCLCLSALSENLPLSVCRGDSLVRSSLCLLGL